jgi:hypothetical protein
MPSGRAHSRGHASMANAASAHATVVTPTNFASVQTLSALNVRAIVTNHINRRIIIHMTDWDCRSLWTATLPSTKTLALRPTSTLAEGHGSLR